MEKWSSLEQPVTIEADMGAIMNQFWGIIQTKCPTSSTLEIRMANAARRKSKSVEMWWKFEISSKSQSAWNMRIGTYNYDIHSGEVKSSEIAQLWISSHSSKVSWQQCFILISSKVQIILNPWYVWKFHDFG